MDFNLRPPERTLFQRMLNLSLWHFVWFSISVSLALAAAMSMIFHGRITDDYLITAAVVSLIVSTMVISLIRKLRDTGMALEKSEKRFASLFEMASDGILLIDPSDMDKQLIVEANDALCVMHGYAREELIGRPLQMLVAGSDSSRIRERTNRLLSGEKLTFEVDHVKKDGSIFDVEVSAKKLDIGGKPYIQSIERDVTERKKMEQKLHSISADWESTFDTITDMITIHDMNFNIIRANRAAGKILNLPDREANEGLKCFRYFHGGDCPPKACPSCETLRTGKPSLTEVYEPHLGGYIEVRAIPRYDMEGKMSGVIHIARDISEKKKTEERLIQYQEALQSVYGIATAQMSVQMSCEQAATSISKLLGISHVMVHRITEESVEPLACSYRGGRKEGCLPVLECGCATAKMIDSTRSVKSADCGVSPDVACRSNLCFPLIGARGRVFGAIHIGDSGNRTFNEEDKRLVGIFARYISSEIERDVTETALRNALKMEAVGKLVVGFAHDVRNPLNAIMVVSDALQQEFGDNADMKPFIDSIRSQVDRMSELVKDLLDLSRSKEIADYGRLNVIGLCSSAASLWMQTKGCTVKVASMCEKEDLPVMGDERKLQQVVLNLLDNADQHGPDNGQIDLIIEQPKSHIARIRIVDSGKGISGDIIKKVFEPFFTTRKQGTGLGLSIVKSIVESHGGSVSAANNDPPPGCTFTVNLPVMEEEES